MGTKKKKEKRKKKKKTKKRKKRGDEHKVGSGSGRIITIFRRQRSIPSGVFSRSSGLGGLICCLLLVNHLHVQIFQVNSRGVFDQVLIKELNPLIVPAEEYSVVLLSLLKSLGGLGSNRLHLLLQSLELLIFP